MSQHLFRTSDREGVPVSVTLGYDRPLDYVFCTVSRDDEHGDFLYSNLGDEKAGTSLQDVDYFRGILGALDIEIPESIFDEVRLDQMNRIGNRSVDHSA